MDNKEIINKNLLRGKTCDNCISYSDNVWDGAICIWYNQLFPKERTCPDWSNDVKRRGRTYIDKHTIDSKTVKNHSKKE